jgi:hypothetical protein
MIGPAGYRSCLARAPARTAPSDEDLRVMREAAWRHPTHSSYTTTWDVTHATHASPRTALSRSEQAGRTPNNREAVSPLTP